MLGVSTTRIQAYGAAQGPEEAKEILSSLAQGEVRVKINLKKVLWEHGQGTAERNLAKVNEHGVGRAEKNLARVHSHGLKRKIIDQK